MLGLCGLYAVQPTPLWLHAVSALAIVAGAVYILRIMRRLGTGGALACATAVALILNDNVARTLNYGFHPEVLYAWSIPWMIDSGLRASRIAFLAATFATVLVKEDACLAIFAVSVALGMNGWRAMTWADRWRFLAFPVVLALANLALYYRFVVPMLTGDSRPTYAHFWGNYGETPLLALAGMATRPAAVLGSVSESGLFRTVAPHLFLPLIGWRWALGVVPIIAIYSASANEQVRAFGIYYAILLVPFLVIAASWGARVLTRRFASSLGMAELSAAGVIFLGALLVGAGTRGYSLRPWKAEIAAVPEALGRLGAESVVLVQSGLFPHAGYDDRFRLLTPETLDHPGYAGAAVLIAPNVSAYPFKAKNLVATMSGLHAVGRMPSGLIAVRLSGAPSGCGPPTSEPLSTRLLRSRPRCR